MKTDFSKNLKRYNYLAGEIEAAYHEMSLALEISDSAMIVLYAVCDQGDSCLLRDICRNFGVSKQTVNSALRKLEAEGVVYMESAGMKNKRVCLTEKGKLVADRTARRMMEAEDGVFASWPREDVEKYLELTELFLQGFKEKCSEIKEKNKE